MPTMKLNRANIERIMCDTKMSQTEVAIRADRSRAWMSLLLLRAGNGDNVNPTTVRHLADAMSTPEHPVSVDDIIDVGT